MNDLRKLLAEATARPWRVEDGALGTLISDGQDAIAECYDDADAALIVAAVNGLPKLLDELESLREVADAAEEYFRVSTQENLDELREAIAERNV